MSGYSTVLAVVLSITQWLRLKSHTTYCNYLPLALGLEEFRDGSEQRLIM